MKQYIPLDELLKRLEALRYSDSEIWRERNRIVDEAITIARNLATDQPGEEAIPAEQWHDDIGPVLWWFFPVCEPPYCGTPNDTDFPTMSGEPYHTHFTRISIPTPPARKGE